MCNTGKLILILASIFCAAAPATFAQKMQHGKWAITFDDASKKVAFEKDGETVLTGVSAKFRFNGKIYDTSSYASATLAPAVDIADKVGDARRFTISYTDAEGLPAVDQTFLLFDNKDYFLTEVTLKSASPVSSNYIAPIVSSDVNLFLPKSDTNRFLTVPFDNDGFVTYGSYPLSRPADKNSLGTGRYARDSISFEVTSIFCGETQRGLVLGSVEHTDWKSAVRVTGSPLLQSTVTYLECLSGITHPATRDHYGDGDYLAPHGALSGTEVKSARFMVGLFDDWRDGMETFGDINAVYAPKRPWDGPTPFGWNSWGGMATNVNFDGVMSVSDFVKENIQDKGGFAPDNVVFIGLDSYWGNLNWDQLQEFCDKCRTNGQIPGIYTTPFTNWVHSDGDAVEGNNGYYYGDILLKVNGKKTGHMDPTHPGTLSWMNYYIDRFKALGIKYIKLDFINQGACEADSFYNKDITTGIQAYNYGMKHFADRCGDDMFIVLSIAPIFPANYANARRISCDAWGEMWHTSYMLNSLSFGWWLDRVYSYNDPDHIVMSGYSDLENKARITSAALTGYCMLGDNLSTAGSFIGNPDHQQKAVKYATIPEINEVINLGKSFRPAYGHKLFGRNNSVDIFYLETPDSWYIAYFNYEENRTKTGALPLSSLGIDADSVDIPRSLEIWTGSPVSIADGALNYSLVHNQTGFYRLYKK